MDDRSLGNRIVNLRGERGWSQEDLAQAAGVSTRTIQRLESGTPPAPETAKAVAAAFDLLPGDLFLPNALGPRQQTVPSRGFKWGIGGALVGYGCASAAILYNLFAGYSSGREAGLMLGSLGAAVGVTCAIIGVLEDRARRAA